MTYLTAGQVAQLLKPINPNRVGTDGKGFSHVEAYDIRAHLTRIFGFARWSADVIDQQPIFEAGDERTNKKGEPYTAWTVAYRTIMRLTVCAPDGTVLATYTEGAVGDASNQPSRADAHDLSLKTSESQALKRCAANLGDGFGLSLYRKGSRAALVKATLVRPVDPGKAEQKPDGDQKPDGAVDAHITDPLPAEGETREPTPADSTTSSPPAVVDESERQRQADALRADLLAAADPVTVAKVARLIGQASLGMVVVADGNGEPLTLAALMQQRLLAVREQVAS